MNNPNRAPEDVSGKIKLDKVLTMAQYSWNVFDRELKHYDLCDSMHIFAPRSSCMHDLGGFLVNITPDIPYDSFDDFRELWHRQIEKIKKLGKPFDFWGVFNGKKRVEGPGFKMERCSMPREEYEYMAREIGHLFLGWEIGEFDGLYGRDVAYYWQPEEKPATRQEAHDKCISYLKGMHQALYSNTNNLSGVTFPHYFNEFSIKMLGAEVAQGLLNTQVYISFLRGACRQYDLQYKIMSSVFDRWGYRCYTKSEDVKLADGKEGWKAGRYHGHSVGLLQAIWVMSLLCRSLNNRFRWRILHR